MRVQERKELFHAPTIVSKYRSYRIARPLPRAHRAIGPIISRTDAKFPDETACGTLHRRDGSSPVMFGIFLGLIPLGGRRSPDAGARKRFSLKLGVVVYVGRSLGVRAAVTAIDTTGTSYDGTGRETALSFLNRASFIGSAGVLCFAAGLRSHPDFSKDCR